MPNKITLELDLSQVETLVGKLPIRDKIRLVKKLEQETWAKRLDDVVLRIKKRFQQNPISNREITRICEEARRKIYNERSEGRH